MMISSSAGMVSLHVGGGGPVDERVAVAVGVVLNFYSFHFIDKFGET